MAMPPVGNSNSINARNCKAAKDSEALLWRALCDEADTATEYMETDCIIVNPLIHPRRSFDALSAESTPTLSDALEKLARSRKRWTSYHMHRHNPEPAFAQPAMMAVQIMYKVTMVRERRRRHKSKRDDGDDGEHRELETVDAFCTSTWKQGSSGGWKLCAQQLVPLKT